MLDIRQTKQITYVGATQLGRLARDEVAPQSGAEDSEGASGTVYKRKMWTLNSTRRGETAKTQKKKKITTHCSKEIAVMALCKCVNKASISLAKPSDGKVSVLITLAP